VHLLPIIALSFAAGIALPIPWPGALGLLLLAAPRRLRSLRVPVLALAAGVLITRSPPPSDLLSALPHGSRLIELTGTVRVGPDLPHLGRSLLTLDVQTVGGQPLSGRVRVAYPAGSPLPSPGARVSVVGRLSLPRTASNPGERDTRALLTNAGISHLLSAPSPHSLLVLKSSPWWHVGALLHRTRKCAEGALRRISDWRTRGLLTGLLLGRRERVDAELAGHFRRTGTTHFLAISGLHVGIIAGTIWLLVAPLPISRRLTAPAVAALVLCYAALTGARPPVLRAALITALMAAGTVLGRPVRPYHLLAFALIAILSTAPQALGSAGVQLSFVAVLAILALSRKFETGLFERWILMEKFSVPREHPLPLRLARRYLRRSLPVALAAWLATAPLIVFHFGTLSLLTVPANLLVLPLVTLLIPAGILALVTGISLPAVALTHALAGITGLLASIPLTSFIFPAPPIALLVAYYAALLIAWRRPVLGRRSALLLVISLGILAVSGATLRQAPREPRLTVLAVGHGLATVLETPEGGILAYDAGSARADIFGRVILPFLRSRRIIRVDALVISHDDSDHNSGVPAFLSRFIVSHLHAPRTLVAGERISLPGAEIEVLWPAFPEELSDNDASTVLRIRTGGTSILLTGDLEEEGFEGLLKTGADLRADILVLPHHGRPNHAAKQLIDAVRPRILISSNGPNEPLDPAWQSALQTREKGALIIRPGPRVTSFR